MKISASRAARRMTLSTCAVAALAAGAAVPAAQAKPAGAELRVESAQKALAGGETHLTDDTAIRTDRSKPACNGTGNEANLDGPSALGLLVDAAGVNRALRPLGISDQFSFGLLVCRIAGVESSDTGFWLYKVNHVAPEVGADQRTIRAGDEVLWYFSDTATGRNTGDELELSAPVRVKAFTKFEVKVVAYDSAGKATPAAGARVTYGQQRVTADAQGVAEVTSGSRPFALRAKRGNDVPSAFEPVCVAKRLRNCSRIAPATVNGTVRGDRIKGEKAPERLNGFGGRDRIDSRGGGTDVIRCGRGVDRVLVDGGDGYGRDCEFVNGSPSPLRQRR